MMNRIKQRNEAIKRMKMLGMSQKVIDALKKSDQIAVSIAGNITFQIKDEIRDMIKQYEQKNNAYVYHCIYCETEWDDILYNLLYVCKYEDDWKYELEDLKNGIVSARVINESVPYFSESGSIGVKPLCGALIRTY